MPSSLLRPLLQTPSHVPRVQWAGDLDGNEDGSHSSLPGSLPHRLSMGTGTSYSASPPPAHHDW